MQPSSFLGYVISSIIMMIIFSSASLSSLLQIALKQAMHNANCYYYGTWKCQKAKTRS